MPEFATPFPQDYPSESPILLASASQRLLAYLIDILPLTLAITGIFYLFFGFDQTISTYLTNRGNLEARASFLLQRNLIRNLIFVAYLILTLALRGPCQGLLPDVELVARDFEQDGVLGRVVKKRFGP
ncbi:hypothetical protein E5J99_09110 [Hymenobacter elongatus]|uniref:RDD domain-containing protein n=1 Tax=Hymenobacter elongatus TaxID=877208 RepID=A0A4Z0PLY4_9BACT|nr:hypothetical protein E5J99_09110 [Hymenobacter elongatus]